MEQLPTDVSVVFLITTFLTASIFLDDLPGVRRFGRFLSKHRCPAAENSISLTARYYIFLIYMAADGRRTNCSLFPFRIAL